MPLLFHLSMSSEEDGTKIRKALKLPPNKAFSPSKSYDSKLLEIGISLRCYLEHLLNQGRGIVVFLPRGSE